MTVKNVLTIHYTIVTFLGTLLPFMMNEIVIFVVTLSINKNY